MKKETFLQQSPPELYLNLPNTQQILHVCPASNKTYYVLISTVYDIQSPKQLRHVTNQGKVIKEISIKTDKEFKMLMTNKLIIDNPSKRVFLIVTDLYDRFEVQQLKYPEKWQKVGFSVFSETRWLCLWTKMKINGAKCSLNIWYYDIEKLQGDSRPVTIWSTECYQSNIKIRKIDQMSKLAWWQDMQIDPKAPITFYTLCKMYPFEKAGDIEDSCIFTKVQTVNTLCSFDNKIKDLGIRQIWESKANRYLLYTTTNTHKDFLCFAIQPITNENQSWGIKKIHPFWNSLNDALIFMDAYTIVNLNFFSNNKADENQPMMIKLFNNQHEDLMSIILLSKGAHKFRKVELQNRRVMYWNKDENGIFEVRSELVPTLQEIYMHMLDHLNEDFDEDFLSDVVELLC